MRKTNTSKGLFAFLLAGIFCSCSSTNYLTIPITEPAPVFIPSKITKLGIVDGSLPSAQNEKFDMIDKILSAEGKNLDRDGARASVSGLNEELKHNQKFTEVKIIENSGLKNPNMGTSPGPLSWDVVDRICRENNVDAIFVLSYYDTESKIETNTVPVEVPLAKTTVVETEISIQTLIKMGWRIYNNLDKIISDDYNDNETVLSRGKGINPMKPAQAVLGRKDDVMKRSNEMGHDYGIRLLPYTIRVSREYYVKGSENFKVAKRRAQTGDWNGAAELWLKDVSHPTAKIAGRAAYNMAIINEINGDYEAAVDWAAKSYTDYNNKLGLRYVNILNRRIQRNEQLNRQLQD